MKSRRTLISFFGLGSHTAAPLLYTYLTEHPQFVGPREVTRFFSQAEVFAKGLGWYEDQFVTTATRTICGELAEDYLENSQAAGLIARTYPNARLLAVIENPLVSVRVAYVEAIRSGKIDRRLSLEKFITHHPEVLLRARYGRQLVHYFSYYAPTDLLVLIASDVRMDLLKSVRQVYAHCGLDESYVPLRLRYLVVEEEDETKKPGFLKRRLKSVKKLTRAGYALLLKCLRPKKVKTETAAELAERITLPPQLETKLKEYFKADVAQLSALLHRNLSMEWGFEQDR